MSKVIDMTGQTFGKLTVLSRAENDKYGKAQWLCQCQCGNQKIINGASLRKGLTQSCGCQKLAKLKQYNEKNVVNQIGNKYGKLTVISRNTDPKYAIDGRAMWNCKCECGNICVVSGKSLRNGHTSSCGCKIKSKGENIIQWLLDKSDLNYSTQYTVKINQNLYQTQQRHPYYFDFAIFDKNNILLYLIEYDGIQHFKVQTNGSIWNTPEQVEKTKIRDMIKNQWCKDNNIPLIRIPYTHLQDLCLEDLQLETSKFII